jgi:Glycosyl transferases group 1
MPSAPRVVVYVPAPGELALPPACRTDDQVSGGPRSLHELAFAVAATGREVELRGRVSLGYYDQLREATGLAPALPDRARRPDRGEIVVIPEGEPDPLAVARVVLSGARGVMMVLAPPGLFGWPLTDGWTAPSVEDVDLDALARPEHFEAAAALGLALWTHMPHVCDRARAAGVDCRFVGNGSPLPVPAPQPKTVDVAWLRANRWGAAAERVAERLGDGVSVEAIDAVPQPEVARRLSVTRMLIWPSHIEGHGRVPAEARAAGCVPVALDTSPYATWLDEASGAVTVSAVDDMPAAIRGLLADPERLAVLAEQGRASAALQLDWPSYVARVDEALGEVERRRPQPAAGALAVLGDRIADLLAAERHEAGAAYQREVDRVSAERDEAGRRLAALRGRRAVRLALRAAELRPRSG